MSAIAAAVVGGAVVSSYASNRAANTQAAAARDASAAQLEAANRSVDLQREMFNQSAGYLAPYRDFGNFALTGLYNEAVSVPSYRPYAQTAGARPQWQSMTNADLNAQLAPNYDFQLQQGLGALGNQMNRTGGLVSGNAQQALQQYAQDYASGAYQQAFQNFNTNQANQQNWWQQGLTNYQSEQQAQLQRQQARYEQLAGIAQLGQASAAGTGANAMSTGQNIGNTYTSAANASSGYLTSGAAAQAAGQVGMGNALSGGLNSYLGWNYLYNRPGASAAPATTTMPGSLSLNR